jgi:hypothetical protein
MMDASRLWHSALQIALPLRVCLNELDNIAIEEIGMLG